MENATVVLADYFGSGSLELEERAGHGKHIRRGQGQQRIITKKYP